MVSTEVNSLHQRAIAAFQRGEADAAVELLCKAVEADPTSAVVANDLGSVLAQMGRMEEAIAAFRRAIELAPEYPEAHNNLANVYQMTGDLDAAVVSYQTALRLAPQYAEGHRNLASALWRLGRIEEASAALALAVSINPSYIEAVALLVLQLKQMCDWRMVDELTQQLIRAVEDGSGGVNPFVFLTLETTPRRQRQCAEQFAQARWLTVSGTANNTAQAATNRERITVGYLSADFQEHATAHLISELFELHDRSRFRVVGYSYGADDGSAARKRLRESFDLFVDLEVVSHADAAARIRADGVDILVDLKGYTTDARPEIMALRPAPIQVSYMGYPGTMGANAIDYILVDRFVVPVEQQKNFTETLVHMPHCYLVNDRRRPVAEASSRAEYGLPEDGFVFCCFNSAHKITPAIFDIWIRLLEQVPGSVLWLLESSLVAMTNLRREADARLKGGAERLIFAPQLANAEHLARFAVADLFLDTLPYNAHTLTSDALWGGCPVLTVTGETFASRVAGSILHTAGLPELVTSTLDEYEATALRLASARAELATLRARIQKNKMTTPLFDTPRFTRELEAAFEWMMQQASSREA
ncbi:tetratricopeptide repeat protein [Acidicapsa dinghuensis]|uniref:protein O-GlcNAc transferase n=1 Tax=Acidicapsa dinghuensis TaxID=2218256 RepID=A0ABW1EMN7_9BACT|nr:tetratricopeptide repeat protein [Acidicapsa dinghuensis]